MAGRRGQGDWSDTGTFLRKPQAGWLHDDDSLINSSVTYSVKYLGCVQVKQSMTTLQYNVRTQVTKEAIMRVAEVAQSIVSNKKRKLPKQVNKLLGMVDQRWASDVSLQVSVESLRISAITTGKDLMEHSLPSISFASGGDGSTADFIGYVAKDPVHERACHVFDCMDLTQHVLTTIGQAFELRYKLYLHTPLSTQPPQPLPSPSTKLSQPPHLPQSHPPRPPQRNTVRSHKLNGACASGGESDEARYEEASIKLSHQATPLKTTPLKATPLPMTPAEEGVYEEEPQSRPRMYSKLPGFPLLEGEEESWGTPPEGKRGSPAQGQWGSPLGTTQRGGNLYETGKREGRRRGGGGGGGGMGEDDADYSEPTAVHSLYSNPGEVTSTYEVVNTAYGRVVGGGGVAGAGVRRVMGGGGAGAGEGVGREGEREEDEDGGEYKFLTVHQTIPRLHGDGDLIDLTPTLPAPIYGNTSGMGAEPVGPSPPPPLRRNIYTNTEIDAGSPEANRGPPPQPPPPRPSSQAPSQTPPRAPPPHKPSEPSDDSSMYDDASCLGRVPVTNVSEKGDYDTLGQTTAPLDSEEIYDDTRQEDITGEAYEVPQDCYLSFSSAKFDDTIYAHRGAVGVVGGATPLGSMGAMRHALPLDPLESQDYFHPLIGRLEAEALLEEDGEFLVRESSKKPGQYVLSGMSGGEFKHLLLMDKDGMVRCRDHHFDSIPALVHSFVESQHPLSIGGSMVYLKQPIVNSYFDPNA